MEIINSIEKVTEDTIIEQTEKMYGEKTGYSITHDPDGKTITLKINSQGVEISGTWSEILAELKAIEQTELES